MTPDEEKLISEWYDGLSNEIPIVCVVSDDDRTGLFRSFCEQLSRLAPAVAVTYRKGDDEKQPPALEIDMGLIYHAIPHGSELRPFLDVLSCLDKGQSPIPGSAMAQFENLETPCFLKLFIMPNCPYCPKMVQNLAPLSLLNDLVKLTIIDGLLFPEMAESLDIKSVPTLFFDDRMRWTGQTSLKEILDVVLKQDPTLISAPSIERLLGEGKAELVADMMMEQRTIFPAFFELLTNEKWSVRLGAMVVMEEIIEQDKSLAEQCAGPLWERFSALNEQVRGDVVYILGEAGNRGSIPKLEAVLLGACSAETKEAVEEALETIVRKV